MKKRAILIIAGDGSHFISYLAVNFGAHFAEENSTSMYSTFIANIDRDGNVNMNPFIQWLLAVIIYKLEVRVTQFLNTLALGLIKNSYLANIGRKCKRQIQPKEHIVCSIPFPALHERQLKRTLAIAASIPCSIHEPPFGAI
jgi:hypothetical protein